MIDLAQLLGFDRDIKPYTEVNYKQDSSGTAKFVLTPIASSVLDSIGHFYLFCAILIASVIACFFVNTSLVIVVSSILLYAICLNAFRFGVAPNFGDTDDERLWLLGWGIVSLLLTAGLWKIHTESGLIAMLQPIIVGLSMLLIWFNNRRIYVAMKEDLTDYNFDKSSFWLYASRLPFVGLLAYTYIYSVDTTIYWIGLSGFTAGLGVMYTILHIVGINDDKMEGSTPSNSNKDQLPFETNTQNNKTQTNQKTTQSNDTESDRTMESTEDTENNVSMDENSSKQNNNTVDTSSKILDNIDSDENDNSDNEDVSDQENEEEFSDLFKDEDDKESETNNQEDNEYDEEIIIGDTDGKSDETSTPDDKTEELTKNLKESINKINNTLEKEDMGEFKLTEVENTPPTEDTINWLSTETDKLTNYLIDNEVDEEVRMQLIDVQQHIEEIKEYIHKYD